jgi:hypothetical protein
VKTDWAVFLKTKVLYLCCAIVPIGMMPAFVERPARTLRNAFAPARQNDTRTHAVKHTNSCMLQCNH